MRTYFCSSRVPRFQSSNNTLFYRTKLSINFKLSIIVKSWHKSAAIMISLCLLVYTRCLNLSEKHCHFHSSTCLIFALSTRDSIYDVSTHYITVRKILHEHEHFGQSIDLFQLLFHPYLALYTSSGHIHQY